MKPYNTFCWLLCMVWINPMRPLVVCHISLPHPAGTAMVTHTQCLWQMGEVI